jgi:putative IMPACT (imprinted ancient) family translation regulator
MQSSHTLRQSSRENIIGLMDDSFHNGAAFKKAGFAIAKQRTSYGRYDPSKDDYYFGWKALPVGGVIRVFRFFDNHIYTCINGAPVSIDLPSFYAPISADELANNASITENHARDTCYIVIPKRVLLAP